MPTRNGIPTLNGVHPDSNRVNKAVRRANTIKELRELQELALKAARVDNIEATLLCQVAKAYCELRDRIRIEKGLIKPGSRNISVREEPNGKRKASGRPTRNDLQAAARAMGLLPSTKVDTHVDATAPALDVDCTEVRELGK